MGIQKRLCYGIGLALLLGSIATADFDSKSKRRAAVHVFGYVTGPGVTADINKGPEWRAQVCFGYYPLGVQPQSAGDYYYKLLITNEAEE